MMYRILYFIILLSSSLCDDNETMLSCSTNPILKKFYDLFITEIKIANEGNCIDDIDESTADIIRYHFGLTNEDKHLNASQLIMKSGYALEEYEVQTPDGYVLTMMRIPGPGPPVLLMHGLVCSADEFLTSGPGNSLAYLLADAKYDVWLGNARGNKYSLKHVSLSTKDIRFWDFSFHEIGVYDLPTKIDFILKKLNLQKLYYVGHSQGTTTSYVMLSEKPEYNDKLILLVSLAPVAWMNNLKSPVLRAIVPVQDLIDNLVNSIGIYDLLSDNVIIDAIKEKFCGTSILATLVCSTVVAPLFGFDYVRLNYTNFPVQLAHVPAGCSNKQLVHYGQEISPSASFQQYDYGGVINELRYGCTSPPRYPVSKITARTAVFYSCSDWLSNATDVHKLTSRLTNLVLVQEVPSPFAHMDYYWAINVKNMVYSTIFELFEKYQN